MSQSLDGIKTIEDFDLENKRVFIRLDLNVPIKNGNISDDTRIREALPTIKYALDHKARVILSSHLGRPKPNSNGPTPKDLEEFTLLPVAEKLQELLGVEVILFETPSGEGAKGLISDLGQKRILLLENSRFDLGEEKNSMEMAVHMAAITDIYINDGFGALHRAHATTAALPSLIKQKGIGFLVKKEIEVFDKLLHNIKHPFVAVLGGAKVSDKIGVIDNLLEKVDTFIIGGAMAYTFLKAQDISIGNSLVEKDKVSLAKDILMKLKVRGKKIILPVDHIVAREFKTGIPTRTTVNAVIPDGEMGLDIGPQTIELIKAELSSAKTVFWNGPMGAFEMPEFEKGTFAVAQTLAALPKVFSVVGGGDSVSAVKKSGLSSKMGHISTGGGASLEYLEGVKLPGIEAFKKKIVESSPLVHNEEDETWEERELRIAEVIRMKEQFGDPKRVDPRFAPRPPKNPSKLRKGGAKNPDDTGNDDNGS